MLINQIFTSNSIQFSQTHFYWNILLTNPQAEKSHLFFSGEKREPMFSFHSSLPLTICNDALLREVNAGMDTGHHQHRVTFSQLSARARHERSKRITQLQMNMRNARSATLQIRSNKPQLTAVCVALPISSHAVW